jgi:hypothetical protein
MWFFSFSGLLSQSLRKEPLRRFAVSFGGKRICNLACRFGTPYAFLCDSEILHCFPLVRQPGHGLADRRLDDGHRNPPCRSTDYRSAKSARAHRLART